MWKSAAALGLTLDTPVDFVKRLEELRTETLVCQSQAVLYECSDTAEHLRSALADIDDAISYFRDGLDSDEGGDA